MPVGTSLTAHPAPSAGGHLPLRRRRCSASPAGLPRAAARSSRPPRPGVSPPRRLHGKRKGRAGEVVLALPPLLPSRHPRPTSPPHTRAPRSG